MIDVMAPAVGDVSNPYAAPKLVDCFRAADQDWLLWWLDRYQIRFSELDAVGELVHMRPHTDLERAIDRVKRRRPEGHDPWSESPAWARGDSGAVSAPSKGHRRAGRPAAAGKPGKLPW